MQVIFKSNELKRLICHQLNKSINDTLYENDLDNITNIAVNSRNLIGERTDVDLLELQFLKNLNSCIISNFEIDDNNINSINLLEKLEYMQFTCCNFGDIKIKSNNKLKNLTLEGCVNLEYNIFTENKNLDTLRIISNNVNINEIKEFNSIKKLYLQNCNITNIKNVCDLEQLEYLKIERSKIDTENLLKELGKKIKIEIL